MRLLILIALHMHTTEVISKKYTSSSESIENLIYYKDCNHRSQSTTTPEPTKPSVVPLRAPAPKNDCPNPKMCCSMSCGNECNVSPSLLGRQMEPIQDMQSMQPIQPVPAALRQSMIPGRKKKIKPISKMLPLGGRRDFGFTKDRIKSLISQDEDIRKILKDLVRVTMQKVDLLELMNSRRSADKGLDASGSEEEEDRSRGYLN